MSGIKDVGSNAAHVSLESLLSGFPNHTYNKGGNKNLYQTD